MLNLTVSTDSLLISPDNGPCAHTLNSSLLFGKLTVIFKFPIDSELLLLNIDN